MAACGLCAALGRQNFEKLVPPLERKWSVQVWVDVCNHGHLISCPLSSHRNQHKRLFGDRGTVGGGPVAADPPPHSSQDSHNRTTSVTSGVVSQRNEAGRLLNTKWRRPIRHSVQLICSVPAQPGNVSTARTRVCVFVMKTTTMRMVAVKLSVLPTTRT